MTIQWRVNNPSLSDVPQFDLLLFLSSIFPICGAGNCMDDCAIVSRH
jgi:hypothetical protein